MTRRSAAAAAAAALLGVLLLDQPWAELPGRVRSLVRFAPRELAIRRLGGSSADFDRQYFLFLERARRRLPPGAPGVAVLTNRTMPGRGVFLTIYELAPLPVLVDPDRVPPGWIALVYGMAPPGGRPLIAELPHGAILGPAP